MSKWSLYEHSSELHEKIVGCLALALACEILFTSEQQENSGLP
jgi:hypothetical protein